MLVLALDVGLKTGYAVLELTENQEVKRHISGTLDLSKDTSQELYDYTRHLIFEYKPNSIVLELPEEIKNNPYNTILLSVNDLYKSAVFSMQKQLGNDLVYAWKIKASEWKTTKSAAFKLDFWKNTKPTVHEKDAVRIAHYWLHYGLHKTHPEKRLTERI